MKELFRVRVQYASRQQCCKTHKRPLLSGCGLLDRYIKGEDIVKFIRAQRIRLLGHVKGIEVGAMQRKMMEGRLFIGRRRGRPRLRWMDDDVADLRVMKIRQWKEKVEDRQQWRLAVKKAHPGL